MTPDFPDITAAYEQRNRRGGEESGGRGWEAMWGGKVWGEGGLFGQETHIYKEDCRTMKNGGRGGARGRGRRGAVLKPEKQDL